MAKNVVFLLAVPFNSFVADFSMIYMHVILLHKRVEPLVICWT